MQLTTTINGQPRTVSCHPGESLADVLRALGLHSVKKGCDHEGTCGACTVLVDGVPLLSCITPAPRLSGRSIVTVEGLGTVTNPHPIQEAFVDAAAVQCGYCTPAMVLSTKALLDRVPHPNEAQAREALSGNLCRCTGYVKVLDAVALAADRVANQKEASDGQ